MTSRQDLRSEETKKAILAAATRLFVERGFGAVTMRQIAREAGCSHTTIYIYFKDKEELLHKLSMESLQGLHQQMESELQNDEKHPEAKLKNIAMMFIEFCLSNRNMYTIFFMTEATRVDVESPALEINRLRLQLFGLLRQAVRECVQSEKDDDLVLAYSRIFFYTLHGILATYSNSEEKVDQLLERLTPTFNLTVDVMLAGIIQTTKNGERFSNES